MAKQPTCLVCQKVMELGFLADIHGPGPTLPRWCAGKPKTPFLGLLGEVSGAQADEGLKVVAYRCPECEALRLYAPATPAGE